MTAAPLRPFDPDTSGLRAPQARGAALSRSHVFSRGGLVCSTSPLAASAGLRVLAQGGNAFDAAIAVAGVEAVTVPLLCGLGGDVFALLYHAPSGRLVGINGSGGAPLAATVELYRSRGHQAMPLEGPLAPSVPGEVHAWETVLGLFGTWPLERLLEPAIGYAEEGFGLPPKQSGAFTTCADTFARYPATAAVFLEEGRPYQAGEVLVQRDLARTLRRVAQGGAEAFYRGDLAREMVRALQEAGGLFTQEDFARHETEVYEPPISTSYHGFTVHQTRPPSQGFLVLEMLNILEGYDLASLGPGSAEAIHLMVEAKKMAFADRLRYFGDPRQVAVPLEEVLTKEWAAERRRLIDPRHAREQVPAGSLGQVAGDTSYFCVADAQGNAVSFIHSLAKVGGSGFVARNTGVLLNNRAARGFVLREGDPNCLAPGKRTMHTLNCYMLFRDGRPWLVGGTPGGDFQPQGNVQIITDLVDFGMDPQEAVEAPRWLSFPGGDTHTLEEPPEVVVEPHMPQAVQEGLRALGHRVSAHAEGISHGVIQLIQFDHQRGLKLGVSDPRGDGHAVAL
ncbi:MAG: gamma-glutamyltransferase [Dehalococcoidia bacterium]